MYNSKCNEFVQLICNKTGLKDKLVIHFVIIFAEVDMDESAKKLIKATEQNITSLVNNYQVPAGFCYLDERGTVHFIGSKYVKRGLKKKRKKIKTHCMSDLKKMTKLSKGCEYMKNSNCPPPSDGFEKLPYPIDLLDIKEARRALSSYIKTTYVKKHNGKKKRMHYNGKSEYRPSWWRGSIQEAYPWNTVGNIKDHPYPGPNATEFYRKCLRACLKGKFYILYIQRFFCEAQAKGKLKLKLGANVGHPRVNISHLRVTIGHLFLSFLKANILGNTTELHPKVR